MRSTQIPSSWSPGDIRVERGPTLLVASDVGGIAPSERDFLAAADVIFCEQVADIGSLMLAAPRALIEPVRGGERAPSRAVSINRACHLADDGWRVVWLTSADRTGSLPNCAQVTPVHDDSGTNLAAARPYEPHPLATAFNGLAG